MADAQGGDIAIEQTVFPRTPVFVGLGEVVEFSATVSNVGATAVPLATFRAFAPVLPTPPVWTFGALANPRCSQMRFLRAPISGFFTIPAWEFDVLNLNPGEEVRCEYPINRGPSAVSDLQLVFNIVTPANDPGPSGNQATWVAGSLTHLEFSVREACDVPPTASSKTMRVTLTNHGPTSLTEVPFGTCLDNFFPAFGVNGNFPGGCGNGNVLPGPCFEFAIGWSVASLEAGESKSCLLQLHALPEPVAGSNYIPIRIAQPYRSGPLEVLDLEPNGPSQLLSLTSPSMCSAPAPVNIPVGGAAWTLMVAGLMLLTSAALVRSLQKP